LKIPLETVNKKIAIGLIGYESLPEIQRCLDPWIGHIDTMILGDGKFDYYDAPNDYSNDGWLEFCEKRYCDKCEVVTYKYTGDQFTKRQKYLDIAGRQGCDYLIAVDTDEYLDPNYQDWNMFYKQLIRFSEITKDRVFYQWVFIPSGKLWPKQGNQFPSNRWLKSAKIHKDPGTMRFCMDSHFIWCPKNVTDDMMIKWQLKHRDQDNKYQFVPRNVIDGVRVRMDRTLRTKEQKEKGKEWAHMNHHAEESKKFYKISKAQGTQQPQGFDSWEEFEQAPHTFDRVTGQRIELGKKIIS